MDVQGSIWAPMVIHTIEEIVGVSWMEGWSSRRLYRVKTVSNEDTNREADNLLQGKGLEIFHMRIRNKIENHKKDPRFWRGDQMKLWPTELLRLKKIVRCQWFITKVESCLLKMLTNTSQNSDRICYVDDSDYKLWHISWRLGSSTDE